MRKFLRALVALHGSPHGIAWGFTLGLGLSLVPVPVLGMVVALALAPWVRANLPATYIGTAVVNPFTGALFYFGELWVGLWLLGQPLPVWQELRQYDAHGWWALFVDLLGPFFLGAGVFVVMAVVVCYPAVYFLIAHLRPKREPRPTMLQASCEQRSAQE